MSETRDTARVLTRRALVRRVWVIAFVYSAISALLVQLVILPYVFPAWHWREGLLAGGDWVSFHLSAVNRAARIRAEGWRAFELRPLTNSPVGIASAIYALTWPKPWTLIPLNAALHATGAALLVYLLRTFVADGRWAVIGAGPFLLYPSALMWVSQIHKDGFFIAGYLSLFAAWAELAREAPVADAGKRLAVGLALLSAGVGLIWLARQDQVVVTELAAGVALAVLAITAAARVRSGRSSRQAVAAIALVALTIAGSSWFASSRLAQPDRTELTSDRVGGEARAPLILAGDQGAFDVALPGRAVHAIPWYRTEWLPIGVDRFAYRIALLREIYLVSSLASETNIDADVGFYRATDLVRYVPRALQIALLAPFPHQWGRAGSLTWTTATRRLVAIEMLGVYVALLSLVAVIWRWRQRPELWVVILPCLAALVPYAVIIPNVGALYRFRYGFLMVLVGLGVAGGADGLSRRAVPRTGGASQRGL